MLKKENRLSGNKQIKEVFEKGKMRQSPLFGVLYIREEKNNLQSTNFNLQTSKPVVVGQAPSTGSGQIKSPPTPSLRKEGEIKFGIVVSKKISKKAVERNRIRRKIYKEVGEILPQIKKGLKVVFLVKKAMLQAGDEEIKREVKKSLEKI